VDFYPHSASLSDEAMTSTGNDIQYMRQGAAIESLKATQNYGDVASDDLSRWIPETIKNQTGAIAVYDQQNQKVLWFLSGASKVLAFYKDLFYGGCQIDDAGNKAALSPWSVYKTDHDSAFTTSAAKYMRLPGTQNFSVLFGDSSGRIFDLNGDGVGDAGAVDITLVRKTRFMGKESGLDYTRRIPKGRINYQRTQQCTLNITLDWGDEYNSSTASVTLDGPLPTDVAAYFGGNVYFGGAVYFNQVAATSSVKSHIKTDWVGRGSVVTKTVSNTDSVRFQVDNIELT
jgi:hypothetical protein